MAHIRVRAAEIGDLLASQAGSAQTQSEPPAPMADATQPLRALQSLCVTLDAAQRAEVHEHLRTALHASRHLEMDKKLLGRIIADVIGAPAQPLNQCLKSRTFEALCLSQLQMTQGHEEEPGPTVYNSVLPNLAGCTDDRGALGRTLLWEGACHLFAGPRQAERRDRFKTVIFNLDVDRAVEPFEYAVDLKLEALKLYETVNPG